MYILPGYVSYYKEDGAIYVTSGLRMNTVRLYEPKIIGEFQDIVRCGGCCEIATPLERFLHEQELLVSEEEIHLAADELRRYMNESLLLTIMPTEGCNFRCPYCYEDHTPISMRRRTLDEIQKYISEQAAKFRHISIAWFGGEPTLCKDVILETCELMQALREKHGFIYTSSMTTNGYLLNTEDFTKYCRGGITSYQITLDGWNHDKTRPHVSGKGTLQRILDNLVSISKLPQEEYPFAVILRHNILPGDEDYSWYDYLNRLFGQDSRFSVLIRPVSDWGGSSVQAMALLQGKERASLQQKHVDYLHKIGMRCKSGAGNVLSQICYASYPHSMVFRADGRIEKCTICLDHPKNQLGYVDYEKGIVLNDDINRLWSSSELTEACSSCREVLSCLNLRCRYPYVINDTDMKTCIYK